MRAPRLLVASDTYPPQINGVSVVTRLTVEGLQARGWECEVIAPRYPERLVDHFEASRAASTTTIPSLPCPGYSEVRLALPAPQRVARLAARFMPDIVHCATEFSVGWAARRVARARHAILTTSYHTDFARYAAAYHVPWLRPAVSRYLARFHRAAARTFTPSDAARRDLEAMGVPHATTWGRGVDVNQFHRRHRQPSLRDAYAPPGACVFLHVGRMAPEKGVDRILRAYHRVRAELPPERVHLVVAGSGPDTASLRRLGTEGVTFLGGLDRADVLPRLYASADAFVFASTTETLGLVVLEAMASGLPVLAAPAGGVAEHLRHGQNGLAHAPGDIDGLARDMRVVALDTALRHRLGVGARASAERHSWDAELDRLDACYRGLLTPRWAPHPA